MPLTRKYLIGEENGVEFDYNREVVPAAEDVSFDPSTTSNLTATDVQTALEQVNHYSWSTILAGLNLIIPQYQQMLVHQELDIKDTAELTILGEVIVNL